jgi:hypothetical protein
MKILKRTRGIGIIYDTEDTTTATPSTENPSHTQWLCNHVRMTEFNFLSQYFPKGHPIFILFGESYFYVITQNQAA